MLHKVKPSAVSRHKLKALLTNINWCIVALWTTLNYVLTTDGCETSTACIQL